MTIQWLGHACFKISHDGYSVVIDPYDLVNAHYPPLSVGADAVIVSHEHRGHNFREGVILSGTDKPCPYKLTKVETFHDSRWGLVRGPNTIHKLEWDGFKLVHMGDFGCTLTDNEKEELKNADVIMSSVGGFRALPSCYVKPLLDELDPKVVIPMHYAHDGCGSRRMERVNALTDQYEPLPLVRFYDTDTLVLEHDTPEQVAVLKYLGGRV